MEESRTNGIGTAPLVGFAVHREGAACRLPKEGVRIRGNHYTVQKYYERSDIIMYDLCQVRAALVDSKYPSTQNEGEMEPIWDRVRIARKDKTPRHKPRGGDAMCVAVNNRQILQITHRYRLQGTP